MVALEDVYPVEYTSTQLIIIGGTFTGFATLAVITRLYARRLKRVSYGADDWMAVIALVCDYRV